MRLADTRVTSEQSVPLRFELEGPNSVAFINRSWIFFLFVVLLFLASRIYGLIDFSLWTDEIFSLKTASLPWSDMLQRLIIDKVHPPLFYVLLKIWITVGGQSLLWLKLFSFFIAAASVIPFYLLCRELNLSAGAMNIALLLASVNGYLIYYAQEVRMYGLLYFFTIVSSWLFVGYVNRAREIDKRWLVLLFAANLLLIYTHYFGWLVVGVENLFLLFLNRRKFWWFSLSTIGLGVCFSPWVYLVVRAVLMKEGPINGLDWIERPSAHSIISFFANLCGPLDFSKSTIVRLLLFGTPILFLFWRGLRKPQFLERNFSLIKIWLLLSFVLPLVFVYAFSIFGPKSIWNERYLLIVVPSFMLLVAIALDQLRPEWLRKAMIAFAIIWATAGGIQYIVRGNNLTRVAWQDMVARMIQVEPETARDVKIYQFETNYNRPIQYYLEESHEQRFRAVLVDNAGEIEDDHFWIAFRENRELERGLPVREILESKGYQVNEEFSAGNIGEKTYLFSAQRLIND